GFPRTLPDFHMVPPTHTLRTVVASFGQTTVTVV
ncbi:MAG: hypothetical protein ACI8R4_002484, partial [Paracoccaceae bacterium]